MAGRPEIAAEQAALDALVAHVGAASDRGLALQAAYVVARALLTLNRAPLDGLDRRTEELVRTWVENPDRGEFILMPNENSNN